MISFFTRKKFLIDTLEGFVDIHNHILPGIDDGAKNVEESIVLLKGFSDFGVTNFVATPHIMHNYYPNTPQTIEKALAELHSEIGRIDLNTVITAAAEHMIDANFETILEKGEIMPLGKNYVLIEMSYLQPSINFDSAIQKLASQRYFAILAHPERYVFLYNRLGKHTIYKKNGILYQLNMLSLSEYYGKDVQKTAMKLLDEGLYDFIASDVHNFHQLTSLKEMKISKKLADTLRPLIDSTTYNFS
ncbi:histidinol phosphatase [Aggregatimonas sangjinii]|uniref:protein-tyrosine-phosphatase n=1 Tax=Aggregatimonas sangjinii TaxID=2583587 RepID=A0A5B7SRN2_9FLAO|nr:CpsB/CapC family capsule biosynthesis tyrosine phosphatase [Aggregatimonas sangjinii]QCW99682.1 histidinol phosphatase [Aggregatimonas sangjinii]